MHRLPPRNLELLFEAGFVFDAVSRVFVHRALERAIGYESAARDEECVKAWIAAATRLAP